MPASTTRPTSSRPKPGLANAGLAAIVISVVGLMIVPLPTWLLDLLIASNLALSVAVLLVALHVDNALKIAAFPTLLLITTLVRLALNVSSTRLILLQAYAGEVIKSFGEFVVRGNYVVGAVVFLILIIIQFVVIAKGSERVAEVTARFTLDAMPGKQMAIDAELRAGSIDGNEAVRRRRQLERESQFYGAMDGAMKFVKGDVIASFLITLINILGGLVIGIGQRGMDPAAALRRYGLLTIGDGLVTQIPALVIATAAGVLVTRVASEDPDTGLADDLTSQIFGAPRALRTASVFVLVLALVPGLPAVPFLIIGGLLYAASRAGGRRPDRPDRPLVEPIQRHPDDPSAPRFVPIVVPWALSLSSDLQPWLPDARGGRGSRRPGIRQALISVQEDVFSRLGVPLPAGRVQIDPELPERHVVLSIHEVPATVLPVPDGIGADEIADFVRSEVTAVLRDRAADFVGIAETQLLLDGLKQVAPATVQQVVPKPVPLTLLAEVLRRLVEEGVSIRDLKGVLEALSQRATTEQDPLHLAEFVRVQLRRAITHDLTDGNHELRVILLDQPLEETIRDAISRTTAGSFLALAPAAGRDIVGAVHNALGAHEATSAVLLTQPDVRRFLRKLIENDLPHLRVVSYGELLPEIAIKPVATARLATE